MRPDNREPPRGRRIRAFSAMAINVTTGNGQALLAAIYKAIDDKKVDTWRYETHGSVKYLTHCADQWDEKAWLKSTVQAPGLVLNIVKPKSTNISTVVYSVYHGRFIEMLLAHFDEQMSGAAATAMPTLADVVKSAA
jgi:hypothetical protein